MTVSCYELNYCKNGINLLIQKAYEGDEKEVNQLLAEGGALNDAIHGYAFGGHDALVNKILATKPELKPAAALGYARAKNTQALAQFSGSNACKLAIVQGYSLAGEETQIRAALNSFEGPKYLPVVIESLAATNQKRLLAEFLYHTKFYGNALTAAARAGQHELVAYLLKEHGVDLSQPIRVSTQNQALLAYVLTGYSEGRHFPEAAKLIEQGVNPMYCLNALAPKNNLDQMDANLLLSTITNPHSKEAVKELMQSQFDLNPEQLDSSLTFKPAFESSLTTERLSM